MQLSRREWLCSKLLTRTSLIVRDDALYRFGYLNSFGVSGLSFLTRLTNAYRHGDAVWIPIPGISRILPEYLTERYFSLYNVCLVRITLWLYQHPMPPFSSAWIGSTQVRVPIDCTSARVKSIERQLSLLLLPAFISGHLFDIGHLHVPLFIASVNLVLCTLLIAECHEYWHFLLCQGFGVGVGAITFRLQ